MLDLYLYRRNKKRKRIAIKDSNKELIELLEKSPIKELRELKKQVDNYKGEQPGWDNFSSKDLHEYATSIQKIVNEAKEASLSYSMAIEEVKNKNPDFYQFIANETEHLERERQFFVREDKSAADNIAVYLLRGFGDRERIGEYDCKINALSAIKEHASKRGELGIYGLFRDEEMTHFIKSDGNTFEITEMSFNDESTSLKKILHPFNDESTSLKKILHHTGVC